jgi:hypothetical protein
MNEIEKYEAGEVTDMTELAVRRPPDIVLAEAKRAAKALASVIGQKPTRVIFNGEQYLEFEDWQLVGKFYGCTVRVVETRPVEYGEVRGFESIAEVVHGPSGAVISRAEAMCLNDEPKWSSRAKYDYAYVKKSGGHSIEDPGRNEIVWEAGKDGKKRPKRERIKIGDEPVPMFQLRSMAQTRACAKALRNAFAWVVVLAGYRPTPAEELPDASIEQNEGAASVPPADVSEPAATEAPGAPSPASEPSAPDDSTLMDCRTALREASAPDELTRLYKSFPEPVRRALNEEYSRAMLAFAQARRAGR